MCNVYGTKCARDSAEIYGKNISHHNFLWTVLNRHNMIRNSHDCSFWDDDNTISKFVDAIIIRISNRSTQNLGGVRKHSGRLGGGDGLLR